MKQHIVPDVKKTIITFTIYNNKVNVKQATVACLVIFLNNIK